MQTISLTPYRKRRVVMTQDIASSLPLFTNQISKLFKNADVTKRLRYFSFVIASKFALSLNVSQVRELLRAIANETKFATADEISYFSDPNLPEIVTSSKAMKDYGVNYSWNWQGTLPSLFSHAFTTEMLDILGKKGMSVLKTRTEVDEARLKRDGVLFKGHGPIQLTWRANYEAGVAAVAEMFYNLKAGRLLSGPSLSAYAVYLTRLMSGDASQLHSTFKNDFRKMIGDTDGVISPFSVDVGSVELLRRGMEQRKTDNPARAIPGSTEKNQFDYLALIPSISDVVKIIGSESYELLTGGYDR